MMILGYKEKDIEHPLDGFGFLVPEIEKRSILGALFTSTLFKNRAPDGHHLLTVFAGGARQPDIAKKKSDELLKLVECDLKDLIGLKGEPVFKDHIYWPKSIPQYEIGYGEIYSVFDEIETENPGLHLAGNFRDGISVPDCIKNGLKLGRKLAES
jgi:oxygen-dependent protoporphyrinogen oxidase